MVFIQQAFTAFLFFRTVTVGAKLIMHVQILNSFLHHDKYLAWEELSPEKLGMDTFLTHLAHAVISTVSL